MSHKRSGIESSDARILTDEEIDRLYEEEIPKPRPIEPFPTERVDVHRVAIRALPDYALGQPPDRVTVGLLDRAGLFIVDTITYTRGATAVLAAVVRLILIYQSLKEGPMKILKFIWRAASVIGAMFAAGSVFYNLLPAEIIVYIVAVAVFVEKGVVIIGDVLDNKKLDGSFKPDQPDTETKP
jgi:hypothetical protein